MLLLSSLEKLDPNIMILINILIEANLKINHTKRKSNHIKLIEFEKLKQRISTNGLKDIIELLKQINDLSIGDFKLLKNIS